jgi:hypothetical protein
MPKRQRDGESDAPTYALSPDPLKKVPPSLQRTAEAAGFTVCDLVVVLEEMSKLFNTTVWVKGPAEGSIHLVNIPAAYWISDKKKRESVNNGLQTELRFNLSVGSDSEELRFVSDCLFLCSLCREKPDVHMTIVQSCNDDSDLVRRRLRTSGMVGGRCFTYPLSKIDELLSRPMPLCLREGYPHYSWPRWAFGAFEGFVARRIQLKRASGSAQ